MVRQSPAVSTASVTIRRAAPEDAAACGRICYEAFHGINTAHGFPADIPSPDASTGLLSQLFGHPGFYCVVAEADGRLAGSNCLDERSPVAGIGPITVDPSVQSRRIGRALMTAVIDRARERGFPAVRLVQAAFNSRSMSLYTALEFVIREPLVVMQGPVEPTKVAGYVVRPAKPQDIEACDRLCVQVHGHHRHGELVDTVKQGHAVVAERGGRIVAYASALGFFGHAVALTAEDLQALIASAGTFGGPGILVPTRNTALFRWCLERSLRIVEPMSLMTMGLYNDPAGAWLPSILY